MIVRPPLRDLLPHELPRPGVNPYVATHRSFGEEAMPAGEAAAHRGRWGDRFGREAPLHLEIGAGNGFYLSGMAILHPEWNFVGIELRYKRVVIAARKLRAVEARNAVVARYDATQVQSLFAPGSLAGVHINHPDPWARDRQAKHRLIGRDFLELLRPLLVVGGELRLKTDFRPHVDTLLESVDGLFDVRAVVDDVKRDGAPWPDEVRTNYQRKADEAGTPVGAVWLSAR